MTYTVLLIPFYENILDDRLGLFTKMVMWSHLSAYMLAQVQQGSELAVDKSLDSAVSFAQSVSQWAYLTLGASVALLFRDLSQRPKHLFIRYSFLVFLLGWFFLGLAIYKGVRVHGAYIAYLMSKQHDTLATIQNINADAAAQLRALQIGLLIFGAWLTSYLVWWVTHKDESK